MRSKASLSSHPIHPMLIALPIGLWVGSFAFDLIGSFTRDNLLYGAGFFCIIAGCAGAALAAVPGAIDLFYTVPPNSSARQRGYLHGGLNLLALAIFITVAWNRGGPWFRPTSGSLWLSLLGLCIIGASGWLGGTLVYRNQIGVDRRYANATKFKSRAINAFTEPACNQSELSDGELMLVTIGSERVVVGRTADGIVAFSDRCTHRGGPLCDGALVGNTVQCPWHGSQFDCKTGRVIAGPAQQPIATYGVELRNGEVYLIHPTIEQMRDAA